MVSTIRRRNHKSAEMRPPSGGFDQFSVRPPPFVLGSQTFLVSSCGAYANRGVKRGEVKRERRPARNRSVEKVDREVARESAVGEPATRQTRLSPLPPLVLRRVAELESPQRYGADQDGKAQAHPDRHDDREIARAREGDETAPGGNRVE